MAARIIAAQLTIIAEEAFRRRPASLLDVARVESGAGAGEPVQESTCDYPKPKGLATDGIKAMDAAIEKHKKTK